MGSQNCEKRLLPLSCPSVCLSTCPSARNNSAPTGRVLMKFNIWVCFRKSVKKVQESLIYNKNNGYFTRRPIYIYDHISLSST